ncbi:carboxypeptidase regulatory-like domain-containing protein [Hamadaea sp. NPDC050747]|uniref:MSCRAMM family protein n=1 Tax=Hamadaea sp. NPDC050747 TaxID=3155789 RepID=UPI0033D6F85C
MSRSLLRGLGTMTAAILAAVALGSPAYAEDTGTISGTITEADGAAAAYATVSVESTDESFNGYATTDYTGHYTIDGVPAGASYRVWVRGEGYPGHPKQYAHHKLSAADADLFAVTAGAVTTVDESFLPTGVIQGKFTDSSGAGVDGAYVQVDGISTASTNTVADGTYRVAVLPGSYTVSFWTGGTPQYAYGTRDPATATVFTVGIGQTVVVDDTALPTGSLAGHVTYADGTPAAYVSVGAEAGPSMGYGQTDATGAYRIDGLQPGDYLLSVRLSSGAKEWAPGKLAEDQATRFRVIGDSVTTVDEQLPGIGRIAGRFTAADGSPMPGLSVSVSSVQSGAGVYTSTSMSGDYAFEQLFAGNYTIAFENWETGFQQWAYGKISSATASVITVTAGQTTTVDDSRLPTGSLRITATDALTGASIPRFEAYLDGGYLGSGTETGELIIPDVPAGTYRVNVSSEGYSFQADVATVTITAGQQSQVTAVMQPLAKLTTSVVDRATGQPVADVCLYTATRTSFEISDYCRRSGSDGRVTMYVEPGEYELFALPERGSVLGAQWVGTTGGTGVQGDAAVFSVAKGQTLAVPTIRLDRAGMISGKVTTSTGGTPTHGYVGIVQPDFGSGADVRYTPIASDGTYTVDYLGPYKWPLYFGADGHANQWSGGTGNRWLADLVKVRTGKTTTYDYRLKQGTKVTITWSGTGSSRFLVRNAVTGDIMGIRDGSSAAPVTAELFVLGPQRVKLQCYCGDEGGPIWQGGTDFATANVVVIPRTGPFAVEFREG